MRCRGATASWPIAATVGTYLGWTAASYLIAGDQWPRYNEALRLLTASTFLNVGVRRSVECLKLFYRSGQWPLVALALVAIPAAGLVRSVHGAKASVLPLLLAVAVPIGVVFGLPWPRYLYPALVLAALGSAVSLAVLAPRLARRLGSRPIAVGASLVVVALVAAPRLAYHASRLLSADDDSAERLARHLDTGVPAAATVVNWEWELDFLAERRFHRRRRCSSARWSIRSTTSGITRCSTSHGCRPAPAIWWSGRLRRRPAPSNATCRRGSTGRWPSRGPTACTRSAAVEAPRSGR